MKKIIAYKNLRLVFLTAILTLFWGCKTNKLDKNEAKAKNLALLETIFTQDDYHIDIEVAYPFTSVATTQVSNVLLRNTGNTANRIDIRGDGNFIKIQNDTLTGYLPFFGEQRSGSGSYGGSNLAIQFDEPLEDLTKHLNKNKSKIELEFTAEQKGVSNEKYDISIDIYPNKNVSVNITPVYKTYMRYTGKLEPVDTKK